MARDNHYTFRISLQGLETKKRREEKKKTSHGLTGSFCNHKTFISKTFLSSKEPFLRPGHPDTHPSFAFYHFPLSFKF
jgi:hypothetical protein